MSMRMRDERGDTLVEILVAIIIMGIVVSALFAAITTTSNASKSHRDLASADAVLRGFAEAAKQAVRTQCNSGNTGAAFTPTFTPPSGISVTATGLTCPDTDSATAANNVRTVVITADVANLNPETLKIMVRTP